MVDHDGPSFEFCLEHIRKVEEYVDSETGSTDSVCIYLITKTVEDPQGESHSLGFHCVCENGTLEIKLDTTLVVSADRWFSDSIQMEWFLKTIRTYYTAHSSRIVWTKY